LLAGQFSRLNRLREDVAVNTPLAGFSLIFAARRGDPLRLMAGLSLQYASAEWTPPAR
jgi:hypothetical protein